ncbi:helix-turn-helix transcriptional regulator [Leptothoe sp. PORK10 BA2]|uniref:helix-turn-helix transcriptional regulator n=1 Tax=Leptothoe sp. PORK10 BA2 TaxID=3110254 RepID=UPI002B219A8B|nr:helix-turn-helix transcriptional regulator [Leptothoe sp. PORK10 BA2]MEA5467227.1 helix-turn-helix transcriptional regulator [Leptothoe sp. PORK10 BA2]
MVLKSATLSHLGDLIDLTSPMEEVLPDQLVNGSPLATIRADNLDLIFEVLLGQVFPFRGFVLFDQAGQLLRSTTKAEDFFVLLAKASPGQAFGSPERTSGMQLPDQVTTLCHFLIDSCVDFPDHALQLYDTVFLPGGIRLYLKTEWINLADQPEKCILVTIEDLTQIAHHRAVCDAYRYGLTTRETEVWELYLQGLSYREVSKELVITLNTVKKHMKGIFSKCNIECRCRHLV